MTFFDLQPTLKGQMTLLRPLKSDDFEALYEVAKDPLIWDMHPQKNRYQRDIFKNYFDGALTSKGALVIEEHSGKIIGATRFYDYNLVKSQITIGYTFLCRERWGSIFNRDVKKAMLEYAFKYVNSVIFEIGESNLRSRKAIEKMGAHVIRTENFDGVQHLVYVINKSDTIF